MATKRPSTPPPAPAAPNRPPYMLIEEIRVQGYKSLVDATLHVRPLTLLAGTNSSGKSSIMQPLLLIKQTMEANYNPAGALILSGPHVQAETAGELVSKVDKGARGFIISLSGKEREADLLVDKYFEQSYRIEGVSFYLERQETVFGKVVTSLSPVMASDSIEKLLVFTSEDIDLIGGMVKKGKVVSEGCFLELQMISPNNQPMGRVSYTHSIEAELARLNHIPGLRSAPSRSYVATSFQNQVKGTFDLYTAGTISQWQKQNETEALVKLNNYLQRLGLTNSVTAKVKNANEVELSVNRLPATSKTKPRKADMVNIADVGTGVSQVLPILVALIAAQEGQLVYVEQPELHLHPRAQVVMAELLAEAAKRGVRVIVETHSSLLLLTVQTLVAEGELKPEQVGLHWFARDAKGATTVTLADVDENGAYGDWPEDFGDVELTAQRQYLDAIGKRRAQRQAAKKQAQ